MAREGVSQPPIHQGPYVDPGLTTDGPYVQTAAPTDPPFPGVPKQPPVDVYDAEGTDVGHQNPGVTPPPHSPTAWAYGRDYYANNGMVQQPFFRNQAEI